MTMMKVIVLASQILLSLGIFQIFTLRAITAAQCIVIGPVCGWVCLWVCGWVCYHGLRASVITKLCS